MTQRLLSSSFALFAGWTASVGLPAALLALDTERVVVALVGLEADAGSSGPSISPDGRYVAFQSDATNLVAGDTNSCTDVFVHDRQTGVTTRVSLSSTGAEGNRASAHPAISRDGRFVAFQSDATNLVGGDTQNSTGVFVHDRETSQTSRISPPAEGAQRPPASVKPSISANGRYVAFESAGNIFVHDRQTGRTARIDTPSVEPLGDQVPAQDQARVACSSPSISPDGRYVAFTLSVHQGGKPVGEPFRRHVFLHDRTTGGTVPVAVRPPAPLPNGNSAQPCVSAQASVVAFASDASNLASGDSNGLTDVLAWDRESQRTTRASVSGVGVQSNGRSYSSAISADAQLVVFVSEATNLVEGDTNHRTDVFVRHLGSGRVGRASLSSSGRQGDGDSYSPSVSADGRYVAFASNAGNLVPGDNNGSNDVFVHDRQTGATARVSVRSSQPNGESGAPSVSADGRYVAFESDANNLVPSDTNRKTDIFVRDRQTGQTTLVSMSDAGVQGDQDSNFARISADGRFVAFSSDASNLVAGGTNGGSHVFVWERPAPGPHGHGHMTMIDVTNDPVPEPAAPTYWMVGGSAISSDGRYVAFPSHAANLAPDYPSDTFQFFVRDRVASRTKLVSVSELGQPANSNETGGCSVSADGGVVAFESTATNLLLPSWDANGSMSDAFVWERPAGAGQPYGDITLISAAGASPNVQQANGNSGSPSVSADGRHVAFESWGTNLAPGDASPNIVDVFIRDRVAQRTERVSASLAGTEGDGNSRFPSISDDGRYVAFESEAGNLVSGDANRKMDVFVWDGQTGRVERVSMASSGAEGNGNSRNASISANGRYVVFASAASNLVAGDANGLRDCFIVQR